MPFRSLYLIVPALCGVVPGCAHLDCSAGPPGDIATDGIFGNDIASGGWCGVQYLDNPVQLGVGYILGDNPVDYNWTYPPGSTVTSGGTTAYPMIRLGSESGTITTQAENGCGQTNTVSRDMTVLTTNALSDLPDFPGAPRYRMASFALGGSGYIVSGLGENGAVFKDVWQFDPATFEWTQLPDAPLSTDLGLAATVDGTAYVVFDNAFYALDLPGTWAPLGSLPFTTFPSFMTSAGGYVFLGEPAQHGGSAAIWQFDPTTATWSRPRGYGQDYESVFGFSFGDALFLGAGCDNCDTSSPTLGSSWTAYDPSTQTPSGVGFSLQAVQFEAWALTDSVIMTTDAGRYQWRPGADPVAVATNPDMICAVPVANIGASGHGSFALGNAAYRVMGIASDPPVIEPGVERYTP